MRTTKQMNLTFTHDQLTPETIANILNSAYITTELHAYGEDKQNQFEVAQATLDNRTFQVVAANKDDILFRSYIIFDKKYNEKTLRNAANFLGTYSVGSSYITKYENGNHCMSFQCNHIIPEDETISAAYLVKLTRYFVKELNCHLMNWQAIENCVSLNS